MHTLRTLYVCYYKVYTLLILQFPQLDTEHFYTTQNISNLQGWFIDRAIGASDCRGASKKHVPQASPDHDPALLTWCLAPLLQSRKRAL